MINAGRVLIIPKGEWTNLESYEMLDLVTRGDIAYIARQASVGVDPATDTQLTYWQPFGTAAKIATTTTPGLVMPDGTTVTIDATGLISANIGISDINNVTITSISNGQILQYNSSTQKWENKNLGSAASRNATSSITSGSTDLIESGAVSSLKQTLETQVSTKAEQSLLAPIQTTLVASKAYVIGEQFVYQGLLYKATAAIAQGGTITINGNCALSDDVSTQLFNVDKNLRLNSNGTYTLNIHTCGGPDTTTTSNNTYTVTDDYAFISAELYCGANATGDYSCSVSFNNYTMGQLRNIKGTFIENLGCFKKGDVISCYALAHCRIRLSKYVNG